MNRKQRRAARKGRRSADEVLERAFAQAVADHKAGRLDAAERRYRRILSAAPDHARALHNLGAIANRVGRHDQAVEFLEKALALAPDWAEAHNSLGNALKEQGRFADALACYDRALARDPDFAGAHNNRGNALKELGRVSEALAAIEKALALMPDWPEAHNNKARVLMDLGRHGDALAGFDRALVLDPNYADCHYNRGMLQLLRGQFADGWAECAWRHETRYRRRHRRAFTAPQWRGQDLAGGTLLLHAEQGAGDTIQCARYLPLAAARAGRVVVETPAPLARLFEGLAGADNLVDPGEPPGAPGTYDAQASWIDLPLLLGTTLETIPADIPYLRPAPELAASWAERLGARGGYRVGITWAGSPEHKNDHNRSTELGAWAPLAALSRDWPDLALYSLQVGRNGEAGAHLGAAVTDLAPALTDYAETAAAMANLDLVIAVDTSVVHLAGALGRPVWALIPFTPDWRWLLDRDDSPWYPTLHLFRQTTPGDWTGVIARVAEALAKAAHEEGSRAT